MTRLRFALLNAAHDGANTRRNFRREVDADLVEFSASDGHLPDHTEFDGVVVTGSRSSVYWDEEWIPSLVDYVAEAADAGLPVLGVCYGHQVLAEEARRARRRDGRLRDRVQRSTPPQRRRAVRGVDEEFTVFTTHGDAVVDLPPNASLIGENDHGVHAFRDGHCWGVQFHPEYDLKTAREVTEGKRERLGDARVDAVLEAITPEAYDDACEAKPLFDNFTEYARRLKADRESVAAAGD